MARRLTGAGFFTLAALSTGLCVTTCPATSWTATPDPSRLVGDLAQEDAPMTGNTPTPATASQTTKPPPPTTTDAPSRTPAPAATTSPAADAATATMSSVLTPTPLTPTGPASPSPMASPSP